MAVIAEYNLDNKRILSLLLSRHTPDWESVTNVLINPSINENLINNVMRKYWKADVPNNEIIEMTQSEKDTVDQEIADEEAQRQEDAKDVDKYEKALKTLAILTFKEINKLRSEVGLSEYTWSQFKQAFKNEYDNLGE